MESLHTAMTIDRKKYNLLRKLFSDSRRLIEGARRSGNDETRLVKIEDLERLNETLEKLRED